MDKREYSESEYQTLIKFYENLPESKLMVDNHPLALLRWAILKLSKTDEWAHFKFWNEAIKRKDFHTVEGFINFYGQKENWSEAQQKWMLLAIQHNIKADEGLGLLNPEKGK